VKLSRTNFGFFSFAGLAGAVLAAVEVRTTGDLATGAFFATGFVTRLTATLVVAVAARLAGARLGATGGAF
jgi:hypothetical protein